MPDNENIRNEIELHGQEDNRISTDASASQDLSGIMKLVPEVYVGSNLELINCHNIYFEAFKCLSSSHLF